MVPDEFGSGMKFVRVSSVYTVPAFIHQLIPRTHAEQIQNGYLEQKSARQSDTESDSNEEENNFSWTDEYRWTFFQKSSQRTKQRKRQRASTGILLGKNTMESWKRLSSVIPITKLHQNLHTAKIKACSQRIGLLQKPKE